ncbi:MAG: ABC-2 family transporter protein [Pirellulaceae bacterium]|nr:ABC-2 family transporter protein [Pirellulaceae bacterium]
MAAVLPRISGGWTIFCIALEERLVYRGDFALGTLMRFLPIVTQIFLWWAIFDTIGGAEPGNAAVAGYSFHNVVAYYLLSMVSRAFSSMPGLASGIALQIRNGEVKKYLVQPVDLLGFLLLTRVAHKLAYYSVAALPFALVFFLCQRFFVGPWPDGLQWTCFVLALLLSFLLGFFLEACIGLLGFWFLEVSSLLFVYMLFNFFLSGHMFPLDMVPQPWHAIVDLLPLKYLAYYPAAVLLGKVPRDHLVGGLLSQCVWVVVFIVLARVMFRRGVRRYAGYGG